MREAHARAELDQSGGLGRPPRLEDDARGARRPATAGPNRPTARPRPSRAEAACHEEAPGRAAERRARCGSPVGARRRDRTRPQAPPASIRAAIRSARAGCRRPRRVSDPGPARPAARETPCPAARARARRPAPRPRAPATPRIRLHRRTRAARIPIRHAPPTAGAPTNASVCADTRSSHCASSTMHTSGCSSAASASRLRAANPTRKRSGGGPRLRPNAVFNASRCGLGRWPSRSSMCAHSACRPANGELHLRLDPGRPDDPASRRGRRQMFQQGALADTRLAAQHQDPALPRSDPGDELIQHLTLTPTTEQARRRETGDRHARVALSRPAQPDWCAPRPRKGAARDPVGLRCSAEPCAEPRSPARRRRASRVCR